MVVEMFVYFRGYLIEIYGSNIFKIDFGIITNASIIDVIIKQNYFFAR